MPTNKIGAANIQWTNLNISVNNRGLVQPLASPFNVMDANGNILCQATKQMDGARLYMPDLFLNAPQLNMVGASHVWAIGDTVQWDVHNGDFIINNITPFAGVANIQAPQLTIQPEITALNLNQPVDPAVSTDALRKIGFRDVVEWSVDANQNLSYTSIAASDIANWRSWTPALYAHCEGNNVRYIGKTIRTLDKRMEDYRRGLGEMTNNRVNRAIRGVISQASSVTTLVFFPQHALQWGDFLINLPAGLEDVLIDFFQPEWNA